MWNTTILVHKLETFVKLQNTTVVVNSSSQSTISTVTSAQDCFPSCIEDATCLVFTLIDTSGSLLTCTRHTDSLQSLTQRTGVTVYFLSPLVKKIVRSGQTRGLAPSSMYNDWTKAACVIDDECRQENSICFMNRCRCRPGFFSTLNYTCSANCSQADLHTTFMDYPDSGIRGHNIVERVGVSLQTCSSLCVRNRVCQSFDFRVTGGRCLLHEVTSLQAQSQWYPQTSRGWTHYQRTCLQFPTLYPGPQWYNSPCSINVVCPEPNSQCMSGRCSCRSPFILSGTDGTCRVPESCRDWQTTGIRSGVYSIQLPQNSSQKRVWCDMDTGDGGWLVFQRRKDGSVDFYRNWTQYENGFGDITGEFWLGLSHLYLLTRGRQQRLRIEVGRKIGGRRYAEYSSFRVEGPETNYTLNLSGYSGNAADSFMPLNGGMFSTYDRDNSKSVKNCAVEYRAGWWYKKACFFNACNLNGQYNWTSYGIVWYYYYWSYDSLHFSEMKLRPA
ncbi:ficolin-1-B-like [Pomacea canaliculata]|uniref:ficolin-1-B-like n=1 Tax=Pomacea canaliculata TaxID=400727 RepID=UPI000D72C623|nr:ficolin-1-B-like [Pomacea canaliculata]